MDNPNQSAQAGTSPKTIAIVAHLTLIGWIIALVMHNSNKSELGAFYLRQMLGLILLGVLSNFISAASSMLGLVFGLLLLVLWILSLIGALNEEKKPTPIVGEYFQDWFKFIS